MRFHARAFVLAVLLCWLIPVEIAGDDTCLAGSYVLNEKASDDVMKAFEPALAEMSPLTRSIARRRLRRQAQPEARLRIDLAHDAVTISSGDRPAMTLPSNGEKVDMSIEDGTGRFSANIVDGVLRVRMEADDGGYTHEYSLDPDGRRLTLNVSVSFDRLPRPVSYQLAYDRT